MTTQEDILDDPNFRPVLNHGFVGILDTMGSDKAVADAARCSYQAGTKTIQDDEALIRYLKRQAHTSPFEMAEIKFLVRAPVFCFRQWQRHRCASINEESARYSIMRNEFFMPERDTIKPQAIDNKQGRAGGLQEQHIDATLWTMETANRSSYDMYRIMLNEYGNAENENRRDTPYDLYADDMFGDSENNGTFPGIARELARTVLPVSMYSTMVWKIDLHNLMHFLKLRLDPHAQYEIRVYAEAMYELVKERFPICMKAFEDYQLHSKNFSRMETELLKTLLKDRVTDIDQVLESDHGLSKREITEFKQKIGSA